MATKTISIACRTQESAELKLFKPFQGDLKFLSDSNYEKLKAEILKYGFTCPLFIWKEGKQLHILDGHQRVFTLTKMEKEGFTIPKIPYVAIEAETREDAKNVLIGMVNVYGTMNTDGLIKYANEAGISLAEMALRVVHPEIDTDELELAAQEARENLEEQAYDKSRVEEDKEVYDNATVKQIVLYFPNEKYNQMVERLEALLKEKGVDNYSDLVWELAFD